MSALIAAILSADSQFLLNLGNKVEIGMREEMIYWFAFVLTYSYLFSASFVGVALIFITTAWKYKHKIQGIFVNCHGKIEIRNEGNKYQRKYIHVVNN